MTLEAVRDLHAPVVYNGSSFPTCEGCDFDGYEAEEPGWPCRTAEVVYSEGEIADVLAAIKQAAEWQREMASRNRSLAPATGIASLISAAYSQMIEEQLRSGPLFQKMVELGASKDSIRLNKVGYILPVTRELLEDLT